MIHGYVILLSGLLLLLLVFYFQFRHLRLKHFFPFLGKSLHAHELVVVDACVEVEHGGVPVPELEIDFAHLPLEVGFVEEGEILGYD